MFATQLVTNLNASTKQKKLKTEVILSSWVSSIDQERTILIKKNVSITIMQKNNELIQ